MASVTGNMAKKYWDDFGIVGPRSQLLKHRTVATLILGNRPSTNLGAYLVRSQDCPGYVTGICLAYFVRTVIRDAALWEARS